MILERQIKQSEEYAIEMYRKKKEEKAPTPNALEVDPVIVYNDIMDKSQNLSFGSHGTRTSFPVSTKSENNLKSRHHSLSQGRKSVG